MYIPETYPERTYVLEEMNALELSKLNFVVSEIVNALTAMEIEDIALIDLRYGYYTLVADGYGEDKVYKLYANVEGKQKLVCKVRRDDPQKFRKLLARYLLRVE